MFVCVVIYLLLFTMFWVNRKKGVFNRLKQEEKRTLFLAILVSNMLATVLFAAEMLDMSFEGELTRNSYGEGSRLESYDVTVEGQLQGEPFEIEVQEREYTSAEIQEIFAQVMEELDEVILGENKSRDRVEKNLNLVDTVDGYPVDIHWELDNYEILDTEGVINTEKVKEEGTLVEVRGILGYGEEEAVYVTHVMIYPETKTGKEKWLDAIWQSVKDIEESTRQEKTFSLPNSVLGQKVTWEKTKDTRGYIVQIFGFLVGGLLLWKRRQDEKEAKQKQIEQMIRDYPDIISKFTLLLSTGMTVKNVWIKIVQGYKEEKEQLGKRAAYEELCVTCHEMQSGISEVEAYERFGKRCQASQYMKFGALLSQNLRKGGKGLSELLRLESIQAFENRKSVARQKGEEASTKLLVPMFGMLAVVMLMVIVPAFLSIQL